MSTTHRLKLLDKYWPDVFTGKKSFEVRFNDRDYREGDILELVEVTSDALGEIRETGRVLHRLVTYVLHGEDIPLEEPWCILGLTNREKTHDEPPPHRHYHQSA